MDEEQNRLRAFLWAVEAYLAEHIEGERAPGQATRALELHAWVCELLRETGPRVVPWRPCVLCGNPSPRLDPAGVCGACRMPPQVPPAAE
jgi:hypothetical protein